MCINSMGTICIGRETMGGNAAVRSHAQRIHNLVTYLQELHSLRLANPGHTTLLNTCTKLKDVSRLNTLIKAESRLGDDSDELPFDLETVIRMCRQVGYFEHAGYLAKKYQRHEDYLRIQMEDAGNFKDALVWGNWGLRQLVVFSYSFFVDFVHIPEPEELQSRLRQLHRLVHPTSLPRLEPEFSSRTDKFRNNHPISVCQSHRTRSGCLSISCQSIGLFPFSQSFRWRQYTAIIALTSVTWVRRVIRSSEQWCSRQCTPEHPPSWIARSSSCLTRFCSAIRFNFVKPPLYA